MMRRPPQSIVFAAPLALLASMAQGVAPLAAQDMPTDPRILRAAEQLNALTPQAVPQQTVRVARILGAGEVVEWNGAEMTAGLPDYKKASQGGPAAENPAPPIGLNSYNVAYEFEFPGAAPAGLQLLLYHPDGKGGMVREVATFGAGRTLATVRFNPRANGRQRITLQGSGRDTTYSVHAHLREELGGFVVPYMLLTIVYEPPGALSTASYEKSSAAGTTLSWGEEHSTTSVKAENPDWYIDAGLKGIGAIAPRIPGHGTTIAAAISVIEAVRPNREDTTITIRTDGRASSKSWSVTVRSLARTTANDNAEGYQYPGRGDFFVVLKDVLFAYAYVDGVVRLAPVAYASYTGVRGGDLEAKLPAAVAAQLRALDPHLTPSLLPGGSSLRVVRSLTPSLRGDPAGRRFTYLTTEQCVTGGGFGYGYDQAVVQGSATTSSLATTTIKTVSGMAASLFGPTRTEASVRYWSSAENTVIDAEAARVDLECTGGEEFAVDGYFDTVFRTILWVRGAPHSSSMAVEGSASTSSGQPAANRPAVLQIGERRYAVRTDASGQFRFRFGDIPRGTGTLVVDGQRVPVTYAGTPISGLRIGAQSAANTDARLGGVRAPSAPGKVRPARPR